VWIILEPQGSGNEAGMVPANGITAILRIKNLPHEIGWYGTDCISILYPLSASLHH